MATKVTRKVYRQIKTEIDISMKFGIIPNHKEKKRSKKRLISYMRIAKHYNLSINTIRGIGKSRTYADYHRIMKQYNGHETPIQGKPTDITVKVQFATKYELDRVYHHMQELITELDKLHSEMAIIKAKKERWFKNGQTTSTK
jgi:hypothetical protein